MIDFVPVINPKLEQMARSKLLPLVQYIHQLFPKDLIIFWFLKLHWKQQLKLYFRFINFLDVLELLEGDLLLNF